MRDQVITWGFLLQIQEQFVGKKLQVHDLYGYEVDRGTCVSVEDINRDNEKELFKDNWVVRIKFSSGREYILHSRVHWENKKLHALGVLTELGQRRDNNSIELAFSLFEEKPAARLVEEIKAKFGSRNIVITSASYTREYEGRLADVRTFDNANHAVHLLIQGNYKVEYTLDASDYKWTDDNRLFVRTTKGQKIISLKEAGHNLGKELKELRQELKSKIVPRKGLKPGLTLVNLKGRKGVAPALR